MTSRTWPHSKTTLLPILLSATALGLGCTAPTSAAPTSAESNSPPASVMASANESPYNAIEWLIGTWRGTFRPIKDGEPPTMAFAWGQGRGFLRYHSVKPDGTTEYEGMIVWHPGERRFVFLKSYLTKGPVLMENGWVELISDRAVRFHMHTHYSPGMTLPWSDGAKAGPGGATLRFRRTLTFDGSAIYGEFLMQRGDTWVRPEFEIEVPERGFEWKRL